MQNYDGQFKLNGQEYFIEQRMTMEVQKLQGLIMKNIIKVSNSRIVNVMVKKVIEKVWQTASCLA